MVLPLSPPTDRCSKGNDIERYGERRFRDDGWWGIETYGFREAKGGRDWWCGYGEECGVFWTGKGGGIFMLVVGMLWEVKGTWKRRVIEGRSFIGISKVVNTRGFHSYDDYGLWSLEVVVFVFCWCSGWLMECKKPWVLICLCFSICCCCTGSLFVVWSCITLAMLFSTLNSGLCAKVRAVRLTCWGLKAWKKNHELNLLICRTETHLGLNMRGPNGFAYSFEDSYSQTTCLPKRASFRFTCPGLAKRDSKLKVVISHYLYYPLEFHFS